MVLIYAVQPVFMLQKKMIIGNFNKIKFFKKVYSNKNILFHLINYGYFYHIAFSGFIIISNSLSI